MYFKGIEGHRDLLSQFSELVVSGGMKGAYLFVGPKGVGKATIAGYLAKYIMCVGVCDDTCRCEYCRLFPNVPDYLQVVPTGLTRIKVSDVEPISGFVSLYPYRSKKRVVFIDDADRLNFAAANMLLKELEECRDHVIYLLVSSSPDDLIPTIVSRCQTVRFNLLDPESVEKVLKAQKRGSAKLKDLKRASPYLMGSLLSSYESYEMALRTCDEFITDFWSKTSESFMEFVDSFDFEDDLVRFIEVFILKICDILRIHFDYRDTIFDNDQPDLLQNLSAIWKKDLCIVTLEKLRSLILDYKRGLNIKLAPRLKSILLYLSLVPH